ncbi:hypothetical protein L7F22_035469 [Adiantum nelumboides]|nr:hypothetical protein [Adiantum nelumboides]
MGGVISFRPDLIHSSQTGFVQDRSILDNVVSFYEAVEWARQTDQPTAIMLLDFEKAYDRVDWGFLEGTLHRMGFPDAWIRGISALYRSASAAVTIGGHVGRTFALSKLVRQGCPLAPYLFLFFAETMALYLKGRTPQIRGLHMPIDGSPDLVEQEYVDEIMIFCQYDSDTLDRLHSTLYVFCCASGSLINWQKSSGLVVGVDDVCTRGEHQGFTWVSPRQICRYLGFSCGSGDLICTMTVDDMSLNSPGLRVLVFSSTIDSLPQVKSLGDVIRFHRVTEDAEHFVEGFELDCILREIQNQKIMLQLFRWCLQDSARLWFDDFGAQLRDVCYDVVKEAFLAHYKHVEDASDVWHQLEACLQKEDECVDAYAWRFSQLWNRWCIALRGQVPPFMLKKHHFVVGLRGCLKLKVECKRPQNYEDALRIAKDKEWKLKHQQAGVRNTSMPYGLGSCYGNVNHAPYASSEVKMDSPFVKSEPMPRISSPIVLMGHCVDAIKGVHDVHVDEIEAHVPIEEEKDMANALAINHVEEMPIVLNVVEYEHEESVAKNVACDEVSFGLCALDVDNSLTSRTMDVFGVALGHVLFMMPVNKKQGTDCIVDDDDWGFDDPAVEMNEVMQGFVDAALGRIWVMQEQQSHEVVMNSSEAIHMYGREGGSNVCVGFDYGLANIEIERNLWDMFTMEEDAEHFVEGFELDCILRGIQDQKIMLQLFRLCLQDCARLWFDDFGAQLRDVCYDVVKEAFLAHYKDVEDASDVWHQLEACLQKEDECVDAFPWAVFSIVEQVVYCLERPGTSVYAEETSFCGGLERCFEVEGLPIKSSRGGAHNCEEAACCPVDEKAKPGSSLMSRPSVPMKIKKAIKVLLGIKGRGEPHRELIGAGTSRRSYRLSCVGAAHNVAVGGNSKGQ